MKKQFEFRKCGIDDLDDICRIQDETFEVLERPGLLRRNSREMLESCLQDPHYTIGAYCDGILAAFAMLYDGGDTDENLGKDIDILAEKLDEVINFKLVIVSPAYRGNGLQRRMTKELEEIAKKLHKRYICITASPDNSFSCNNIEAMGYVFYSQKIKYNGVMRNLYYKELL